MTKYSLFLIDAEKYDLKAALKGLMNNEEDFLLLKELYGAVSDVPRLSIGDKVYLYMNGEGICARATVIGNAINIAIEGQYEETAKKYWVGNSFEEACVGCNNCFIPVRIDRIAPTIEDEYQYYTNARLIYNNESENKEHYSISEEVAAQIDYQLDDIEYEEVAEEDFNRLVD